MRPLAQRPPVLGEPPGTVRSVSTVPASGSRSLPSALRNVAVYFGLAEGDPDDVARAADAEPERPSLRHLVVCTVLIATVIGGLLAWRRSAELAVVWVLATIAFHTLSDVVRWARSGELISNQTVREFAVSWLFQIPVLSGLHAIVENDEPIRHSIVWGMLFGAVMAAGNAWECRKDHLRAQELRTSSDHHGEPAPTAQGPSAKPSVD